MRANITTVCALTRHACSPIVLVPLLTTHLTAQTSKNDAGCNKPIGTLPRAYLSRSGSTRTQSVKKGRASSVSNIVPTYTSRHCFPILTKKEARVPLTTIRISRTTNSTTLQCRPMRALYHSLSMVPITVKPPRKAMIGTLTKTLTRTGRSS